MALKVLTYVGASHIQGFGLFAAQRIEAGQTIWEFDPAIDSVTSIPEDEKFSWKTSNGYVNCGDNARYTNHSYQPNTVTSGEVGSTVAARVNRGLFII